MLFFLFFFFFFQAEDGIRDTSVTGVQTCALPILAVEVGEERDDAGGGADDDGGGGRDVERRRRQADGAFLAVQRRAVERSEERRVGKEGRSRGWRYQ